MGILILIIVFPILLFVVKVNQDITSDASGASLQIERCPLDKIWDGTVCRQIRIVGGIAVVGMDSAIQTRFQLDEIEKSFTRRAFVNFPEMLFYPNNQDKGKRIQNIRLANFNKVGNKFRREWEFILNVSAKNTLDLNRAITGSDALGLLIKHMEAQNDIWNNSFPAINRQAYIKRIIITADELFSAYRGGWQVVNDTNFGWWANDKLNNVPGFISYDIDSRWAFDENWSQAMIDNNPAYERFYKGVKVDYGVLHELTHHLPVGDNYVYKMGSGMELLIPEPGGKYAKFTGDLLRFMQNDHMTDPTALKLSGTSSNYINFFWQVNLTERRAAQFNPYPTTHVYGKYFVNELTISITNLDSSGIDDCAYFSQSEIIKPDGVHAMLLIPNTDYLSIDFDGNECKIVLSEDNQLIAFPGRYVGLYKDGIMFPIYLPRNVLESLYWSQDFPTTTYTLELEVTPKFVDAFSYFKQRVDSGSGEIHMIPSLIDIFVDNSWSNVSNEAIVKGSLDRFNNIFYMDYQF